MSAAVLSFFAAWSIKALALALVCSLLFLTLRRHAPSARALYLFFVTASFLALPVLAGLLPSWSAVPRLSLLGTAPEVASETAPAFDEAKTDASSSLPAARGRMVISVPLREPVMAAKSLDEATRGQGLERVPWGLWALTVWMVGAAALLAHFCWALCQLEGLRRRARATGLEGELPVVEAPLPSAVTFGVLRPVIVLPSEWRRWNGERLALVLAHETEHVRRRDWAARVVGEVAACLYWPLPLARAALRRMRLEQELSCDRAVVASGLVSATRYGEHLIDMATNRGPGVAFAATIVHKTTLEERLMKLHDSTPGRRRAIVLPLFALFIAASVVAVLGAEEPVSSDLRSALERLESLQQELEPLEPRLQERERELDPYVRRLEEKGREMERELAAAEEAGVREMEREIEERARRLEELHRASEVALRGQHDELAAAEERFHDLANELAELQQIAADSARGGEAQRNAEAQRTEREEIARKRAQMVEAREALRARHAERSIDAETRASMDRLQAEVVELGRRHAARMQDHQRGLEPLQREMAEIQAEMADAREGLQEAHEELSKMHEKIEPVLDRLREAQRAEMSERLRSAFGSAPSESALDRFDRDVDWQIRDGALRLRGSAATLRELLTDEYPSAPAETVNAVVLELLSLDIRL